MEGNVSEKKNGYMSMVHTKQASSTPAHTYKYAHTHTRDAKEKRVGRRKQVEQVERNPYSVSVLVNYLR